QRQMGGCQRDPQAFGGEHHHGQIGAAEIGEKLGMAGEGVSRLVDDALVYGARDHRIDLTGDTGVYGYPQGLQHIVSVILFQLACVRRRPQPDGNDVQRVGRVGSGRRVGLKRNQRQRQPQLVGALAEQLRICNDHMLGVWRVLLRQHDADVGPDAGGLAGSDGDSVCHGASSLLDENLDVGLLTYLDQPVLQFDIEFAATQLVLCLLAARLAGHVGFAALEYLGDVPAIGSAERFAELVDLQLVDDGGKIGWHTALIVGPAHVAAGNHRGRVVRQLTGDIGEVLSSADTGVQRINEFLGLVFGADLVGRNEDVAHVALVDQAGHASPNVHQLD